MRAMGVLAGVLLIQVAAWGAADEVQRGSVIFIHPDGTSAATWAAARALHVGPDADLNWDKLPAIAVYRGHMADSLTATSNGGATTHAYGVKVASDAYGRWAGGEAGRDIVAARGRSASFARQAIAAGLPVGLVQTGTSTEPGTGCFLASVTTRRNHDAIAAQLVASGAAVMLGGGEQFYLPEGTDGVHGPGARKDDRDLIAEARQRGYTVVRTRKELLSLPPDTPKVLGLFAANHTFNDQPEEELAAEGLPPFDPDAPTVAEMTRVALGVLSAHGQRFLLIVEEEATDNFGNRNNAMGMLEAMRRADEAIGVAREHLRRHPRTLILTAADSDAGGMRLVGMPIRTPDDIPAIVPPKDENGAPQDGCRGTGTPPFMAKPDRRGRSLPFAVVWAARDDVSGGVLVRAEGLNSHLVRGSFDNTQIAELMRRTILGPDDARPAVPPPGGDAGADGAADAPSSARPAKAPGVLDFRMPDINGKEIDLSVYSGKVALIVNVASRCGHTPQYRALQALHEKYADRGLAILAFPANDFGGQEPGSNAEIREFCTTRFGVTFPLFAKISVKGQAKAPLYRFLTDQQTNGRFGGAITWNFEKFLVNREGRVVARFSPRTKPDDPKVVAVIEQALTRPGTPAAPSGS